MQRDTCQPDTYQAIFEEHAAPLRRFAWYKTGDWQMAEDLAQDAFLKLWKHCAEVPFDKAKGFLYTVANNLFLDQTRKQKVALKFRQNENAAPVAYAPSADFDLEMREYRQKLESAISELPETQRVAFLMNRIDKMTYADIAARLDISVKAVEKRMHLALLHLRESMDDPHFKAR